MQDEAMTEAGIELLKAKCVSGGAFLHNNIAFQYSTNSGMGIFATAALAEGNVVISIPYDLCISLYTIQSFLPIAQIIEDNPGLLSYPDEIMAIALMYARTVEDSNCPWHLHTSTMPDIRSFSTPLYWNEEDLQRLKGHNIFHLTGLMKKQLKADFESVHVPLAEQYPSILGIVDFMWIYSKHLYFIYFYLIQAKSTMIFTSGL